MPVAVRPLHPPRREARAAWIAMLAVGAVVAGCATAPGTRTARSAPAADCVNGQTADAPVPLGTEVCVSISTQVTVGFGPRPPRR